MMRNIVREPATGEYFFPRPKIIKKICKALDAKHPILFSGPIRSGKTSILKNLIESYKSDYNFIYINITASDSSSYYIELYNELLKNPQLFPKGYTPEDPEASPKESIINLLKATGTNSKFAPFNSLVIILDSFSDLLNQIDQYAGYGGYVEVAELLKEDRAFRKRIEQEFEDVLFLYATSTDIDGLANRFNIASSVYDLQIIDIPPLSASKAKEFVDFITEDYDFSLGATLKKYLFEKLQWLDPYQIQLIIYEIDNLLIDEEWSDHSRDIIDKAFVKALDHRYYFEKWDEQFNNFLGGNEIAFAEQLISLIIQSFVISDKSLKDLANELNIETTYQWVMDFLIANNYLKKAGATGNYKFKSSVLEYWWADKLSLNDTIASSIFPVKSNKKVDIIKIQHLNVQNIKCFQGIELTIDDSQNTAVVIGTNGKGKSTILQLLALGLSGIKNVPLPDNWKDVVKKGCDKGAFEIGVLIDQKAMCFKFEIDANDDTISCIQGKDELEKLRDTFILLGYGVNRSFKLEKTKPNAEFEPIGTLFGENRYLKHIEKSSTYETVRLNFDRIKALINEVFAKANGGENVQLVDFDSDGLYFTTPTAPSEKIPTEALSEGYKSTFVWLLDAIVRIVEKGGSLENADKITGIILLDEIDSHLHPTWQRTILGSVDTLFPNIQFIVTTHSPFVLQSTRKESFVVLETDKDTGNVSVVDKGITSDLSYESIVQEIFNIEFSFSREIELEWKKFKQMIYDIRAKKEVDMEAFEQLAFAIADRGIELDSLVRLELRSLESRIGKTLDIWKK